MFLYFDPCVLPIVSLILTPVAKADSATVNVICFVVAICYHNQEIIPQSLSIVVIVVALLIVTIFLKLTKLL